MCAGLLVVLLLGVGAGAGIWLASRYYQPLLATASENLAVIKAGRANLETLATEQGQKLGELVQASKDRQEAVRQAQDLDRGESAKDYAEANRIQQERSDGDQCMAATAVIDQELGL